MKALILGIFLIVLGVCYWAYCSYDDKHSGELPNIGGYFISVVLFICGCVLVLLP